MIFELVDERNALERILLHFAHFKKQVEKIDDRKVQVMLHYDKEDESAIDLCVMRKDWRDLLERWAEGTILLRWIRQRTVLII